MIYYPILFVFSKLFVQRRHEKQIFSYLQTKFFFCVMFTYLARDRFQFVLNMVQTVQESYLVYFKPPNNRRHQSCSRHRKKCEAELLKVVY